jgi:chromosome segregation ATPase
MTVTRSQIYESVYTLRNASAETKELIIEHPVSGGTTLAEPASADERTGTLYRFAQTLAANGTLSFTVREERPVLEQVVLARTQLDSWLSYTASEAIPANIKAALEKAVELKRALETERAALAELNARLERLTAEQARIRSNLEAAGTQSPQGQEYLRRLASTDGEIDGLYVKIDEAAAAVRAAERELDRYLSSLSF